MRIILIGKSCSGKSTISKILQEKGLTRSAVTTTSREPRSYEVEGVDYYFVSEEEFEKQIDKNNMLEYDVFNDWYYGITKEEFNQTNLSIVTPRGLQKYRRLVGRDNLFVVYVDTPLEVRYERIQKRGDDPKESLRRFVADEKDFEGFKDWDFSVDGSEESYEELIKIIVRQENFLHI
jgi:guanylate kinase